MRGLAVIVALCAVLTTACGGGGEASPPTTTTATETSPPEESSRAPAPAIEGRTLDGEEISLADYRGRPVLVNVWSYW